MQGWVRVFLMVTPTILVGVANFEELQIGNTLASIHDSNVMTCNTTIKESYQSTSLIPQGIKVCHLRDPLLTK